MSEFQTMTDSDSWPQMSSIQHCSSHEHEPKGVGCGEGGAGDGYPEGAGDGYGEAGAGDGYGAGDAGDGYGAGDGTGSAGEGIGDEAGPGVGTGASSHFGLRGVDSPVAGSVKHSPRASSESAKYPGKQHGSCCALGVNITARAFVVLSPHRSVTCHSHCQTWPEFSKLTDHCSVSVTLKISVSELVRDEESSADTVTETPIPKGLKPASTEVATLPPNVLVSVCWLVCVVPPV